MKAKDIEVGHTYIWLSSTGRYTRALVEVLETGVDQERRVDAYSNRTKLVASGVRVRTVRSEHKTMIGKEFVTESRLICFEQPLAEWDLYEEQHAQQRLRLEEAKEADRAATTEVEVILARHGVRFTLWTGENFSFRPSELLKLLQDVAKEGVVE